MKFLNSPLAPVVAVGLAILVFGVGLTSPIWLIVGGKAPLDAIHAGTPLVVTAILGLGLTIGLGVLAAKLRGPDEAFASQAYDRTAATSGGKHALVHVVVMLMFIIPFLTIVIGYLLHSLIDFDAG